MSTTGPLYANGNPPPIVATQLTNTANTNFDGTGTMSAVATGTTAPGYRINRACVSLPGTGANTVVNWFLSTDGGTTKRFLYGTKLTSAAVSATQDAAQVFESRLIGLNLADANHILYASTYAATLVNVLVEMGKY